MIKKLFNKLLKNYRDKNRKLETTIIVDGILLQKSFMKYSQSVRVLSNGYVFLIAMKDAYIKHADINFDNIEIGKHYTFVCRLTLKRGLSYLKCIALYEAACPVKRVISLLSGQSDTCQ